MCCMLLNIGTYHNNKLNLDQKISEKLQKLVSDYNLWSEVAKPVIKSQPCKVSSYKFVKRSFFCAHIIHWNNELPVPIPHDQ